MAVHKLETWFTNDLAPEWPCPSCHRLSLKIMRESFFQHDTRSTQENLREYWFEPDQHTSVFSCLAKCTRDNCREVVACSGEGIVEANIDTETGQKLSDYEQLFCPRFFFPALHPVEISRKCPDKVRAALYASFSVYLSQPGSAANLVRISVEELLDALGIRDTNDDGRRLPLGVRLEDHIPEKYAEYANILKAIKFLGNVGSHKYDSVKIGDIEDAYDIMEFVTSSLYAGRRESIDALAARLEDRFK
ncbi:hypothetical protein BOM23_23350 [Erwinia sp. OLMDLW33]|nr:hypothetical protein BOM23_23350 [Erwinia sp. OLMDLW33]